ncbi:MAG: hypothetical protein ACK4OK_09515, partial [Thermoflexus sp.]
MLRPGTIRFIGIVTAAFLFGAGCGRPGPAPSPTASPSTPRGSPAAAFIPSPTATPASTDSGRFAVEFIGEPSSGIRMEVPAFERAGDRLRVYVAFRNVGEKIGEFYAPFARGDDAELRAGGEGLRPAAISPNFQDDICPEYPRGQKVCLWLPSAVERGWFEFRLPQDAQPPFVFRFPGFGKVELRTDRPLRGEVWKDLPTGPFPERRWQGDPVVWVRNRAISSIRLGLREIQVAGGTMRVTWELRHPEGLVVIGEL